MFIAHDSAITAPFLVARLEDGPDVQVMVSAGGFRMFLDVDEARKLIRLMTEATREQSDD